MSRRLRNIAIVSVLAGLAVAAALVLRSPGRGPAAAPGSGTGRGGSLVVSTHIDPGSFNRHAARDATADLVGMLAQATLVRINRITQEVEPWLAEGWTRSDDGLRYTLTLRPGLAFSDGHPCTADDVVFSFEVVSDERTGSVLADQFEMDGRNVVAEATGPRTVVVTFPKPYAPGLRLLERLPILPRHLLGAALKNGTLARAWGLSTPPSEIVGLGPFVLSSYAPGQRLVFERNPSYFRKDERGAPLPYLDRLTVEVIPDQETELLRLEAGQLDMTTGELRPEDFAPLKRAAEAGRARLLDLGGGYEADSLWFNLKPGALGADPRAAWLQRDELRLAVSMAVDRGLFADTVFLGAGVPVYGPVMPANTKWFASELPPTPYDPARAKALLASIGLTDRNHDGVLEDARNQPARFTLMTQKGRTPLERGAAVIRGELGKIGLGVDVVSLDAKGLIQRFLSADYDAVYFHLGITDSDPATTPDFWFSSGSAHVWNIGQKAPATAWERRVDELMTRQVASGDEGERKRLFDEVQKIFSEHLPIISFVAPRIYVATSSRVTHVAATAFGRPQLLWEPDTIAVK